MCKMYMSQVYPLYDNRFSIYLVLVSHQTTCSKNRISPGPDSIRKQGLIGEDLKIQK